ncbi:MAG: lysophospholipid acyltransferase family protein [Saprospiraceae bacterium]
MKQFGYFGFRLGVVLFSLMPFWMLYRLADLLFLMFFHIMKYRYAVVIENLQQSFPEKSAQEIRAIAKQFYKNLCDILLEGIKGLSMSKKQLLKRYHFAGTELFEKDFANGQSIILVGSHLANWEWGVLSVSLWTKHTIVGIYKPIKNKLIDAYFNEKRKRWGMQLAPMSQAGRAIVRYRNQPCAFVLIADQTPSDVNNCHWIPFLNRETAFLQGADKLARSTNYPVYYFDTKRLKRGYYVVTFYEFIRKPAQLPETEVTRLFAQKLEQSIRETPADWLWSHKRWKRKRLRDQGT